MVGWLVNKQIIGGGIRIISERERENDDMAGFRHDDDITDRRFLLSIITCM
jgi:hypothetical protein